jgi:hypothetical protein
MRLIFRSVQMEEGMTIADYNIQNGNTVVLQLAIAGGGKRGANGAKKAAEVDKDEVLMQLKVAGMTKAQMAAGAGDVVIGQVCGKIEALFTDTTEKVITAMMDATDTHSLQKLGETLRANKNADSKIRIISKLMFKNELSSLAARVAAGEALSRYKDGAIDMVAKYAISQQFMDANGDLVWADMEKEIEDTVKDRIYEEGRDAGRRDAEEDSM